MSPAVRGTLAGLGMALGALAWTLWREAQPLPCEVLGDAAGRIWVEQKHPAWRVYADSLPDLETARRYEEACNAEM